MTTPGLGAPAETAPAELPAALVSGSVLLRPALTVTPQPGAVVVLVDIEAKAA